MVARDNHQQNPGIFLNMEAAIQGHKQPETAIDGIKSGEKLYNSQGACGYFASGGFCVLLVAKIGYTLAGRPDIDIDEADAGSLRKLFDSADKNSVALDLSPLRKLRGENS